MVPLELSNSMKVINVYLSLKSIMKRFDNNIALIFNKQTKICINMYNIRLTFY